MNRSTWKAFERRVAGFWGSVRNALSGGNSKLTRSDSIHPRLFISCKHGIRSAFWTLYKEELPKAEAEDKTVVLALGNKNHDGHLIAFHCDAMPIVVREWLIAHGHNDLAKLLASRYKTSQKKTNSGKS